VPRLPVAHIREQGQDIIIVPLESAFGNKSPQEQQTAVNELQARASSAGLAGIVVPVWDAGGGRMAFIALTQWHPFFNSINLQWVSRNINRELFW